MPKSSSESSSKLEFSDSEFVFGGGVKFKGGIDMGDGGRERDRDLGVETGIWRLETGIWRVEMGIWGMETVIWGVDMGIWGWGSLPILPSKESSLREWRGDWYCRGTHTF